MQLRSGIQKPAADGWVQPIAKRQRRDPLPEQTLDEREFSPRHGDVIIRETEIPETSSPKVISALNLIRIYWDPDPMLMIGVKSIKFDFQRGDLILRFGQFQSHQHVGHQDQIQWRFWFTYGNEFMGLYLYWPTLNAQGLEEPRWYLVAGGNADPPQGDPPAGDTTFPGPVVWNTVFAVVRYDYIVHREPHPTAAWRKAYQLRIAPERVLDNDNVRNGVVVLHNIDHNPPRLYGTGDIVVRIRRTNPNVTETNHHRKFVTMFAYGFLCLGGQNPDVYTYRWRYLGMDQAIFRNYLHYHSVHIPPGLIHNIQNPDTGHSPVRPGDIVINLDRHVRKMWSGNNRADTHTWLGGHVLLYPDGPAIEFPQNFNNSMILRLGNFAEALAVGWAHNQQQGQGPNFGIWMDAPVQLFTQEQLQFGNNPTWWIQEVQEEVRLPAGELSFPPAYRAFRGLFEDTAHIELGHRQIDFKPVPTDLIISVTIWDDHLKMVNGYPLAQGAEDILINRLGPPYDGDNARRQSAIRLQMPQILNKEYRCFYWFPEYRAKDQDCLVRFGSEPADQSRPADRGGNWVLSVELYTFGLVTPLLWTVSHAPHYIGHWALRGVDRRLYPASQ